MKYQNLCSKLLTFILVVSLNLSFFTQATLAEVPTPPVQPTVVPSPTSPGSPIAPTPPESPLPVQLSPTPGPSNGASIVADPSPTASPALPTQDFIGNSNNGADSTSNTQVKETNVSDIVQANYANIENSINANVITGHNDSSGNVGDTQIKTGDAKLDAMLNTTANKNEFNSIFATTGSQPSIVSNSDNGQNSQNTASSITNNHDSLNQNNSAQITNDLNLRADSGKNNSSKNVGDTTLTTGDANLGATVITAANTNIDGVAVAEFNVNDNHTGDIVIAFPASDSCTVTVCGTPVGSVINTANGENSTNSGSSTSSSSNQIDQGNSSDVTNNLVFAANTGDNQANKNTGGSTSVETGDANVSANVFSLLNNNIIGTGNPVLFGVVNIFGNLIGDIIIPDLGNTRNSTGAINSGNGAGSNNAANISQTNSTDTTQNNTANIDNKVKINSNTGDNTTDKNTYEFGQGSVVESGDASINANVINVANNNVDGDTWWVVLVNNAGHWAGQIMGANPGDTHAGSTGTQFVVDDAGNVIAINNTNNGADSSNSAAQTTTNSNTISQNNTANLANNITINANTGGNSTTKNTGGDTSIKTGDTNVILNIVNFVNNNFTGGKFVFTLVNVFGSWTGNVITPGSQKSAQENTTSAIGGPQSSEGNTATSNNSDQHQNTSSNNNSTSNSANALSSSPIISHPISKSQKAGKILGLFNHGSQNNIVEDNTIQVPSERDMNFGNKPGLKALFASLGLSLILLAIRHPEAMRRLATFMGLL